MNRIAALASLLAVAVTAPASAEVRLSPGEEIGHVVRPSVADGRGSCVTLAPGKEVGHRNSGCGVRHVRRGDRGA